MEAQGSVQCSYVDYQGRRCEDQVQSGCGLCFWHDANADKRGDAICARVEAMALSGRPLSGFQLQHADLRNIHLVNRGGVDGYDLTDADLHRADLRDAHLFNINLQGASLLKVDARHASLNAANLKNANLLGIRLDEAKIEHVKWGDDVLQAARGLALRKSEPGRTDEICRLNEEAEEVCRNIRRQCEIHGLQEEAGEFFQKEIRYRRYQLPLFSWRWIVSKTVDLLCGYGERPLRVVAFSAVMVVFCAVLYALTGVSAGGELVQINPELGWSTNVAQLMECLYFSVVTFTTLGYGDIAPIGIGRAIAAIEAFLGTFILALYVVVFVKKVTR